MKNDLAMESSTTTTAGEPGEDTSAKEIPRTKINQRKRKKKGVSEKGEAVKGFTVLGEVGQFKKQVVRRVLPNWLSDPCVVSSSLTDAVDTISSLDLCSHLITKLQQNFINYFFPVQKQVIPWIIQAHSPKLVRPSDLCVSAPTGSGKTLAYVLPIVEVLMNCSLAPRIQAIVVLPTEILASQIYSVFLSYCTGTDLKVFHISRNVTLKAEKRALVKMGINGKLRVPFNIIVTTPGRLIDHIEHTEGFDISHMKFLVIDEADRTLDDQEGDWLRRLEMKFWSIHAPNVPQPWKSIPLNINSANLHVKSFQKLLFSATLSQNPESLENLHLFQPKLFTSIVGKQSASTSAPNGEISESFVGKFTTPLELKESFVLCRKETKPLTLAYLITKFKWKRVLCFVNTKENTHRLCTLLKLMGNLRVREISSTWRPFTRDIALKKFAEGQIDILVTSDQMCRGIDIPSVEYVISYDLPSFTKTYIHRIGRTARAGQQGNAISLVVKDQIRSFQKILKKAGKPNVERLPVKNSELKPLEPTFKLALSNLKIHLEDEKDSKHNTKNAGVMVHNNKNKKDAVK